MVKTINLRDEAFAAVLRERFGLTARELDVAQMLAEGACVKRQAQRLGLSLYTLKAHTKALYRKMDLHSQLELAATVYQFHFAWFTAQQEAA